MTMINISWDRRCTSYVIKNEYVYIYYDRILWLVHLLSHHKQTAWENGFRSGCVWLTAFTPANKLNQTGKLTRVCFNHIKHSKYEQKFRSWTPSKSFARIYFTYVGEWADHGNFTEMISKFLCFKCWCDWVCVNVVGFGCYYLLEY